MILPSKTVYVVRHAKSSWDFPELADLDRPLNTRGLSNAPEMGQRLKDKEIIPDLVISSPAKRAHETCRIICHTLGYDESAIKINRELYHGDEDEMLELLKNLPDKYETVMLFGHNPAITFFVNDMTGENIHNVPTCGVVAIKLTINEWKEVDYGEAELIFFDYPKKKD